MESSRRSGRNRLSRQRLCTILLLAAKELLLLSLGFPTALSLWRTGSIPTTDSHTLSYQSVPRSCDCGANTTEALALGCKYDSLAAAWLPEHCRDDELTAEFERSGDGPNGTWQYWADTKHTQPMSLEEVGALADHPDQLFHMDNEWHVIHCIFYWRKEHRARFNGKIVEPRSDNEGHIKHCGHIFKHGAYGTVAGVPLNTDHGHFVDTHI
jgi:hypothetical protein